MKDKTVINFCFKGERDYVQGPDMFNKTMQEITKQNQRRQFDLVDMVMRGVVRRNMDLYTEASAPVGKPANATISLYAGNARMGLVLLENDKPIQCTYAYPEHEILSAAKLDIDKQEIRLLDFSGFTLIEKIVALNKALLHALYPGVSGKWYFTRIKINDFNLSEWQEGNVKLHLGLKQNLQFKLTNTVFHINEHFAGNIYFSLV